MKHANPARFDDGTVGYAFDDEGELDILFEIEGMGLRVMDLDRATAMRDALTSIIGAAKRAEARRAQADEDAEDMIDRAEAAANRAVSERFDY